MVVVPSDGGDDRPASPIKKVSRKKGAKKCGKSRRKRRALLKREAPRDGGGGEKRGKDEGKERGGTYCSAIWRDGVGWEENEGFK